MRLTYAEYQYIWERLPQEAREAVQRKCVWEQMNRWGVLSEWNDYIPPDLLRHIEARRGQVMREGVAMSENEKLRSLLAEARDAYIALALYYGDGPGDLHQRIDDALANTCDKHAHEAEVDRLRELRDERETLRLQVDLLMEQLDAALASSGFCHQCGCDNCEAVRAEENEDAE